MESDLAIEARGVFKSFGRHRVLDGVDLSVRQGETMVILGPSGGGKSTLLRCLVGLERPDRGSVCVQGVDLFAASPEQVAATRERMGMAFQAGALFGSMTLAQNVDVPLAEYTGLPASTREIVARIKLGMVGPEEAMDRYPSELSGGMRKRASLARAMALDPSVLFFDEPSAGLDPVTGAGLDRLLVQMKEVFDVTLLVVTHELSSAFLIADRIAMMHEGRFLIVGSPEEVRECQNPVVRRFLDRQPEDDSEAHSHLEDFA